MFVAQAATVLPLGRTLIVGPRPWRLENLGVQLYTVRNVLLKDPAATFRAIEDIGYTEVEIIYAQLDQIWPGPGEAPQPTALVRAVQAD